MDETLRGVLRDVFGLQESGYREDLTCQDIENWDSVLHLTLLLTLEQTFGVSFEPEEGAAMTSVPAIKEALRRRLGAAR
jgi:acyl carrier protein